MRERERPNSRERKRDGNFFRFFHLQKRAFFFINALKRKQLDPTSFLLLLLLAVHLVLQRLRGHKRRRGPRGDGQRLARPRVAPGPLWPLAALKGAEASNGDLFSLGELELIFCSFVIVYVGVTRDGACFGCVRE